VPSASSAGSAAGASARSLAERLTELAEIRGSGLLHLPGPRGGDVFLVEGRVTVAETPLSPGAEAQFLRAASDVDDPGPDARAELARRVARGTVTRARLELVVSSATVDAVTELCRADDDTHGSAPLRPGQTHWLGDVRPLEVAVLLAEVDRRRAVLDQIAARVTPESVLVRVETLPVGRLRLSAAQWELMRAVDGSSPVAALARVVGRGVFGTTLEAYGLVRLGVLAPAGGTSETPGDAPGTAGRPERSFLRAAESSAARHPTKET
jgi:hypothetical protein